MTLASAAQAVRRTLASYLHHARGSLYAALVTASAIHILNSLNVPLELPATMLLANVAQLYEPNTPQNLDTRRHLAVVEIDQARFEQRYGGRTPLDRCALKEDIESLLRNPAITVIAIDLDLSPVDARSYRAALPAATAGADAAADASGTHAIACPQCPAPPDPHACQRELDALLAHPPPGVRIATLLPLLPADGPTQALSWANPTDFPRIEFARADLTLGWGMVHDYLLPPTPRPSGALTLAEVVTRWICSPPGPRAPDASPYFPVPDRCGEVPRPEHPAAAFDGSDEDTSGWPRLPISHYESRHLFNGGRPLTLDDSCLSGRAAYDPELRREPCDIRFVLLGGSYGHEDRYLTALGVKTGVELHAAIAAQVRAETPHYWGFLADIAIGCLIFGPLVHGFWRRYFMQRAHMPTPHRAWQHPSVAYLWLVGLALTFALIAWVIVYLSATAYAGYGVWISPVPVAAAMLVEGVVTGSVQVANHVIRDVHTTAYGPTIDTPAPRRLARAVALLPRACAVAVIFVALGQLFSH